MSATLDGKAVLVIGASSGIGEATAQNLAASMRALRPEDIADAVVYALGRPEHVAVNEILIRPTDQLR